MIALTGIPVIDTPRLRLRGPEAADFDTFAGFMASPRAARVGGPVSRAQAWRSFGHLAGHWLMRGYSMFILADRDSGAPLGILAFLPLRSLRSLQRSCRGCARSPQSTTTQQPER